MQQANHADTQRTAGGAPDLPQRRQLDKQVCVCTDQEHNGAYLEARLCKAPQHVANAGEQVCHSRGIHCGNRQEGHSTTSELMRQRE